MIGTSCDEELVKIALNRLGVLNYFEDIITCSKVNKSRMIRIFIWLVHKL